MASIIKVTGISEPGTMLAVTSNRNTLQSSPIIVLCGILLLLVTANVSSLPILFTLMMEVIRCSVTLILTGTEQHNIPEEGILQLRCCRSDITLSNIELPSVQLYAKRTFPWKTYGNDVTHMLNNHTRL
jgi:hypothetical protein